MSTRTVAREAKGQVIAGVKVGGRFAKQRREAGVSPVSRTVESEYAQVTKYLYSIVSARTPVVNDRDDIVQDASIELFRWAKRHGHTDLMQKHKGVVARAAINHLSRYSNAGEHHTSNKGREILRARVGEMVSTLRRPLTNREFEALAEQVRIEEFPPGRRPKIGYHLGKRIDMPLAMNESEEMDEFGDGYKQAPPTNDEYHVDPAGGSRAFARVLDRLVSAGDPRGPESLAGPSLSVAQAREQIWDVFHASDDSIPKILPHLTPSQAKGADSAVSKAGGAAKVANAWLQRDVNPEAAAALFAPFAGAGAITDNDRDAIAEKLSSKSGIADQLWDIARRNSVKRR